MAQCEVTGKFKHGTTNAYLLICKTLQKKEVEVWIPKSQISYKRLTPQSEQNPTPEAVVHIPVWLAQKKGIDYEEI